ncbi:MBL fold metallo-hydrolase [Thermomonas sp.]|uniref:MBL fold metallo-hydrolase n=1 Tax=Thermomonas sp. TaxID=1971895 RepID=UPI002487BD9C|nr:MBL fold metallo-hydrolase [Thermomonas sp.]MDI1251776.1 MBL fold metallo-hydrolase [Thermomonas sp.]
MTDTLHIAPFFHEGTGTWTYVVHRDGDGEHDAIVIDTVLDYDPKSGKAGVDSLRVVQDYIAKKSLRVHRILETHAHADHLSSAQVLRAATGASVGIGDRIRKVQDHFASVFGIDRDDPALRDAFDATYADGDVIEAGNLHLTVLATPGHTSDSLSYAIEGHVFIGDTLFAPDVGCARCDFPGGSVDDLYASIQRLYAMDDATVLHLCHDYPPAGRERRSEVSVGESKRDNRMLRGDTTLEDFSQARRARDAQLPAPVLLYPALQVNIRGGRLPPARENGQRYLCTPVQGDLPAALD